MYREILGSLDSTVCALIQAAQQGCAQRDHMDRFWSRLGFPEYAKVIQVTRIANENVQETAVKCGRNQLAPYYRGRGLRLNGVTAPMGNRKFGTGRWNTAESTGSERHFAARPWNNRSDSRKIRRRSDESQYFTEFIT